MGLYQVPSIEANTLTTTIKDVRPYLDEFVFDKLRGQGYNGASAMSRAKCGVAKQIHDLQPWAVAFLGMLLRERG